MPTRSADPDGALGTFWSHDQAVEVARDVPNLYLETARVPLAEVALSVRELREKVVWGTDPPFVDYTFEYERMARATASEEGTTARLW